MVTRNIQEIDDEWDNKKGHIFFCIYIYVYIFTIIQSFYECLVSIFFTAGYRLLFRIKLRLKKSTKYASWKEETFKELHGRVVLFPNFERLYNCLLYTSRCV